VGARAYVNGYSNCIVLEHGNDGRVKVRYDTGETYRVRSCDLQPVLEEVLDDEAAIMASNQELNVKINALQSQMQELDAILEQRAQERRDVEAARERARQERARQEAARLAREAAEAT